MKLTILAVFVLIGTLAPAQAQQQKEPETPSLRETTDYITSHLEYCGEMNWAGTIVSFSCGKHKVWLDAMSVDDAGPLPEADQIYLSCRSGVACVTIDERDEQGLTLHSENAEIRDNVVRALNHFFRLLKQQNMPANDPFGPKL